MTQQVTTSGKKRPASNKSMWGSHGDASVVSALSDTDSTIRREIETNGAHICSAAQSSHCRRKGKKNPKAWAAHAGTVGL